MPIDYAIAAVALISTIINLFNIRKIHSWYKIYNYVVFAFEIVLYVFYVVLTIMTIPLRPSKIFEQLWLATALSFYAYFGYKFFKIIDNCDTNSGSFSSNSLNPRP
jgi:hypothetical protein